MGEVALVLGARGDEVVIAYINDEAVDWRRVGASLPRRRRRLEEISRVNGEERQRSDGPQLLFSNILRTIAAVRRSWRVMSSSAKRKPMLVLASIHLGF